MTGVRHCHTQHYRCTQHLMDPTALWEEGTNSLCSFIPVFSHSFDKTFIEHYHVLGTVLSTMVVQLTKQPQIHALWKPES